MQDLIVSFYCLGLDLRLVWFWWASMNRDEVCASEFKCVSASKFSVQFLSKKILIVLIIPIIGYFYIN